jgi:anti-sigma factor RsiW
MASQLSKLHSSEAMILMYIADELSPADRAEVDRRIAGDDSLRELLVQLGSSWRQVESAIEMTDAGTITERRAAHVAADISRMMRQWMLQRPVKAPAARTLQIPRWAYAAVAAMLALAIYVWPSHRSETAGPVVQAVPGEIVSPDDAPVANNDSMAAVILHPTGVSMVSEGIPQLLAMVREYSPLDAGPVIDSITVPGDDPVDQSSSPKPN